MTPLTDAEAALLDGCCLVFGTGSRLYGCAEPGSDRDLRGIAAPTRADYLELRRPRERTVAQGADVQTWGLHHWCDVCQGLAQRDGGGAPAAVRRGPRRPVGPCGHGCGA